MTNTSKGKRAYLRAAKRSTRRVSRLTARQEISRGLYDAMASRERIVRRIPREIQS